MKKNEVSDGLVKFKDELIKTARRLYSNNDGAYPPEDLFADTCVRALIYASFYREGTNLLAWLKAIMRSVYINWWRKNKIRTIPIDGLTNLEQRVSPQDFYIEEKINRALERLGKTRMSMVKMRMAGASYQEIADRLCVPVGTVSSGIKRSCEKLLHILREAEDATGAKSIK